MRKAQYKQYFTDEEFRSMMQQLIDVCYELHELEKIAHRDIKPSNIFLINNQYKMADFGVCKIYDIENFGQTNTIIGTIPYFSPQLKRCFETQDYSTLNNLNRSEEDTMTLFNFDYFKNDVFSLGLTLLFAATLKPIINCNTEQSVLNERLNYLRSLNIYSNSVITCIEQMLQWEESQRPGFTILRQYLNRQSGEPKAMADKPN